MATYKIHLINEAEGIDQVVDIAEDAYILDSAEAAGMDLPFSCRSGICSSCTAELVTGEIDQTEGSVLTEGQKKQGLVLLCIGYPRADCQIRTHQEAALF